LRAERKIYTGKRELKAARINQDKRNFLNKALRDFDAVGCVVDKSQVYNRILNEKKSIVRFKDYCLKLMIKAKILE